MPKLKMYPANNGDAFLIINDLPQPMAILVDGGYESTFNDYILPDLTTLAGQGYSLNLVVATHIDGDHILGLLEFFKKNGRSQAPEIIPVLDVWHNSVRNIGPSATSSDGSNNEVLLAEIRRRGFPKATEAVPAEISAKQGSSLAALLLLGEYQWNMGDGTKSINCEEVSVVQLENKIELQVIGPTRKRLDQLLNWWSRYLRKLGFTGALGVGAKFDDAFEFLCADESLLPAKSDAPTQISSSTHLSLEAAHRPDTSVTNASSITFIANVGTVRLLFLGDAWVEDIVTVIKAQKNTESTMIFDVIKLSHHGSARNTSTTLLALIDAPAFFISSNGDVHNHPDFVVLKAIVDRPSSFCRNLYFSHSTPASRQLLSYKSTSGADFVVHENANDWVELGS